MHECEENKNMCFMFVCVYIYLYEHMVIKPVTCVFLHRHVIVLNSCIHLMDNCTFDVP